MGRYPVLVIGGGASGLMAANQIRFLTGGGETPLVLEGNDKLGKKLLATGNGRCNLTNLHISPERYHGDPLAAEVVEKYPACRVLEEFEKLGLLCRADGEGRVYPNGNQAAAVLRVLGRCPGTWIAGAPVRVLQRKRGGFRAETGDGRVLEASRVILACGGMASPAHSMGGLGYELARSLGHTVRLLSPSLVPLRTSSKVCGALKGMRTKAKAVLFQNGKQVYAESGEVIFGSGQLSGICIFNLSARLRETGPQNLEIGLDLLEHMALSEVSAYLRGLRRDHPLWEARELLSGALNLRVGQELVKAAGLELSAPLKKLTDRDLDRTARLLKDWRFPITGMGSWEDAQVTAGGVPLGEIDRNTMESKLCPGLFLTGELLDVDGDCGGYNLHWAWVTGMLAGRGAVKSLKEEGLL